MASKIGDWLFPEYANDNSHTDEKIQHLTYIIANLNCEWCFMEKEFCETQVSSCVCPSFVWVFTLLDSLVVRSRQEFRYLVQQLSPYFRRFCRRKGLLRLSSFHLLWCANCCIFCSLQFCRGKLYLFKIPSRVLWLVSKLLAS
jgi:hypothetical protein